MRGEYLVLRQNPINRCAEPSLLRLRGGLPEDMVRREVGRDAIADGPLRDLRADGDDLAREVGAGHEVVLLPERVLALGDDEVAVLERDGVHFDKNLGCLERGDRRGGEGEVVEAVGLSGRR